MGSRVILLAGLTAALVAATLALAAAPRLIMVSGATIERPVLLSDADEVVDFYSSFFRGTAVDRASLEKRPSLRLGLFWDNGLWEPYVRDGRLGELRPEQANQVGRFYPAVGDKPALVDVPGYGRWPKLADAQALGILARHGVPVRLDSGGGMRAAWIAAGAAALMTATLAAIGVRWRLGAR
jgi:hypothetical protein